ncbi:MAG: cytochrome c maturation protein CcmE [Pseudomonadota bacterium]|nr:cytochrome c maturation protein CcmE [Pseudomonadota bacterium]
MKARHKRLGFLLAGMVILGLAAYLVLNALNKNLSYFFSPTQVLNNEAPAGHVFRLGGLVTPGSLQRGDDLTVNFIVTDNARDVPVQYTGILPDLFQEGQGVIAQGKMNTGGVFVADEVLAKHDENYMPPEVADALEQSHQEGVQNMIEQQQQAQ